MSGESPEETDRVQCPHCRRWIEPFWPFFAHYQKRHTVLRHLFGAWRVFFG